MTTFDPARHVISGDATAARSWVEGSLLPKEQKTDILTFVSRFESLTFVKEDDALLDHLAQTNEITIPSWFREIRKTLAFVETAQRVRLDDFAQYLSPRSDIVNDIWYQFWLGYFNEEQRELLRDKAHVYPIGCWWDTNRSYLAIDLKDPTNTQILEFALEDLMDNDYDGKPLRDSISPVFESYAQLLAHITAIRFTDGTEVEAKRKD